MWSEDHVLQVEETRVRAAADGRRLRLEHVEGRSGDPLLPEHVYESGLVEDRAAGGIHEEGVALQARPL